jgi:hypothetical protein
VSPGRAARLAAAALLVGCVSSETPAGPAAPGRIALQPSLFPSAADAGARSINRIRTTAVSWSDGSVLAVSVFDVSPSDASWRLDITLSAAGEGDLVVYVYLLHVDGDGVESIEFSGRTDPFAITRGAPATPDVSLVRGPLANLFTTSITVTAVTTPMLVGDNRTLTALVTTSGATPPTLYWTSLDTAVVTVVDSTATAVSHGTARIVASAGTLADTALLVVAPPDALPPTVLATSPPDAAVDVGIFASVSATFDEDLDAATVNTSTFQLRDAAGVPVVGTVSYSDSTATFDPAASLDTLATYTATLTTGVRDAFGNALVTPHTWSFTTTDRPVRVLSSFDPGLGLLVAIGLDPATGNLFLYDDFAASIFEYTPAGTQVAPAIPNPGTASNDHDFDFLLEDTSVGGTVVPAGALLVMNGEITPRTIYAIEASTGAILATLPTTLPNPVGMSYHTARTTFFAVDWVDDLIRELDPSTGAVLASFPVTPAGAPAWDMYFGDIEVDQETGRLLLVSSSQGTVRVLAATGAFVADHDAGSAGVGSMSGIAWNDLTSTAWLSTTQGIVHHVDGIVP